MKFFRITQWFNNLTIRSKLIIIFLLITILPLILLAFLSNQSSRQALTQAANNVLFSVAYQTAESLDTFVINNLEKIRVEAQLPAFSNLLNLPPEQREGSALKDRAEGVLFNLFPEHLRGDLDTKYFLGFSLLDKTGTIVLDTHIPMGNPNPYLGLDWSDRRFIIQATEPGSSYSSAIEVSQTHKSSNMYFSATIANDQNERIGVLVSHYDSLVLQEIIAQQNNLAGPGSFGVIFDENFIHLAHGTHPELNFTIVGQYTEDQLNEFKAAERILNFPVSVVSLNIPELEAGLKNSSNFFSAKLPITGNEINQIAVVGMTTHPWQVAFFQPQEIFLEPVRQQTTNLLIFSGLIIILTLVVVIFAAQGLANPITRLTATAEMIASGDLSAKVDINNSQDELGMLARSFNTMTSQIRQNVEDLENRIRVRTNLLRVSSEVGRAASTFLHPDELIRQMVNLINERFGTSYTSIYLLDELGEWAELKASTGEAGKDLVEKQHRVPVRGKSMIGSVIQSRKGQISSPIEVLSTTNRSHFQQYGSEIVLPLLTGDRVLGVLNVHSSNETAFNDQNLEALQNIADQVAIALQNARLYQQAQLQLAEISRLNQIAMQEGWESFQSTNPHLAIQFKKNRINELSSVDLPSIREVIEELGPVFSYQDGKATVTLPLLLRNQFIGALHLKADKDDWEADELTIIDTVTRQAALAFENARLVEAAQQLAYREQQINQISAMIRSSIDIETILQTTITQLSRTLNVEEASIQMVRDTFNQNGGTVEY